MRGVVLMAINASRSQVLFNWDNHHREFPQRERERETESQPIEFGARSVRSRAADARVRLRKLDPPAIHPRSLGLSEDCPRVFGFSSSLSLVRFFFIVRGLRYLLDFIIFFMFFSFVYTRR